jgi:hypothetical protein
MSEYTVDDIITTEVESEQRKWWPASENLGRPASEYRYSIVKALSFTTKDGKYTTGIPDTDGFSYWRVLKDPDLQIRLGRASYDYVFGCMSGLESAVNKLNELIKEYHL